MADEYGECVVTQLLQPDGSVRFRIDRADPVVRLSPELLGYIPSSGWPATFDGKVLRIYGVNRTVVYRIRDVLEPRPGEYGHWDYVGEWPD